MTLLFMDSFDDGMWNLGKCARPVLRSGTTDYVGVSKTLATSYAARQDLWETDPNTAVAWTEAGVNAAEIGFEVRDS